MNIILISYTHIDYVIDVKYSCELYGTSFPISLLSDAQTRSTLSLEMALLQKERNLYGKETFDEQRNEIALKLVRSYLTDLGGGRNVFPGE